MESKEEMIELKRFLDLKRPIRCIVLCTIACWILLGIVIVSLVCKAFIEIEVLSCDRIIFLVYLSTILANWSVYFLSREDDKSKTGGVQSLRLLLNGVRENWADNNALRKKASTTMAVMSIMIAVSIVILSIAGNIFLEPDKKDLWEQSMLGITVILAFLAFICFIVSVDALDTMFNSFKKPLYRKIIGKYYYDLTINPKYCGFVSMIMSVIFLIQVFNPVIASVCIAPTLYFGYYLWYPDINRDPEIRATIINNNILSEEQSQAKKPWFATPTCINLFVLFCMALPVIAHYLVQSLLTK